MAENYIQFSEIITGVTPEQKEWLIDWLLQYHERKDRPDKLEWSKERGLCEYNNEDADVWPRFDWVFTEDGDLWIRDDGGDGSVEDVAVLVKTYFKRFKFDSYFTLTWAETCSKPRVGEFTGGGFIVTPHGRSVKWSTPDMLFNRVKNAKRGKGKPARVTCKLCRKRVTRTFAHAHQGT